MSSSRPTLAVVGVSHPFRGGIAHYSTCLVKHLRKRYAVEFITFTRQYPNFLFPGKTQYDESANPIREPNQRLPPPRGSRPPSLGEAAPQLSVTRP